ncbi:hypothetical protein [Extibacter muris]|uniref:hypothetical protein n=1 Tax=Extibacter muris TaxID=1796622 RepID=UPI001D06FB1D|nr:hypothetical protein [Extibacter muris]MCB6201699.1 hypothetical protein [Extibacter muris]
MNCAHMISHIAVLFNGGLVNQTAGREPVGICSDASEALTISRIPNPAECAPTAAYIPQDKGYGKDSPPLPLTPAHLPPGSPPAIYFT